MRGSATPRGSRAVGLALLGVAAWLLGARASVAGGCHAEQRPEHAISFRVAAPTLAGRPGVPEGSPAPNGRVAPRPCQGEFPGLSVASAIPAGLASCGLVVPPEPDEGPGSHRVADSAPVHPRSRSETPDRPPRRVASRG